MLDPEPVGADAEDGAADRHDEAALAEGIGAELAKDVLAPGQVPPVQQDQPAAHDRASLSMMSARVRNTQPAPRSSASRLTTPSG